MGILCIKTNLKEQYIFDQSKYSNHNLETKTKLILVRRLRTYLQILK